MNVPSPEAFTSYLLDKGLNNFQRRLVYQHVRRFHPDLVAIGKGSFIQIIPYVKAREDAHNAQKARKFEELIESQIGLRWPIEAMAGSDLKGLTTHSFIRYVNGREDVLAEQLDDLKAAVKERYRVLVGHNLFMDLMYFYQCFIGRLPDRVEDFQKIIHHIFPVVVDTKYLATHSDTNPVLARSSLQELDEELSSLQVPIIGNPVPLGA